MGEAGTITQRKGETMKEWQATFTGRKVGALGKCSYVSCTVTGNTEEDARVHLYDTYEHITNLKLSTASSKGITQCG